MRGQVRRIQAAAVLLLLSACVLSEEGTNLAGVRSVSATGAAASSGGGATAAGSGGSLTATGAAGADGACGDGALGGGEACDDGGVAAGDGCSPGCEVEGEWACEGEPSRCTVLQPRVAHGSDLGLSIPDDAYDGTVQSMGCVALDVLGDELLVIEEVRVTLAIDHPFVGDLVAKLQSPAGTVTTLFSRPGHAEPADDGADHHGQTDGSDLSADYPIILYDAAETDAELLGDDVAGFGGGVICQGGGQICEYRPSPGAGPGVSLADVSGESAGGTWRVCVGDAAPGDAGVLRAVTLHITSG